MTSITSRVCGYLALLGCWLLAPCLLAADPAISAREYEVKAVYLYNFTKFVEWPAHAFSSPNAPLVICVVGDDPFGKTLDRVIRDESVQNHPLTVVRVRSADQIPDCHIVFICRSEKQDLEEIVSRLKDRPTLIVADMPQAAERGAMVNLAVQGSVKLEVNPTAVARSGLQVSSKLLGIARIITGENSGPPASSP